MQITLSGLRSLPNRHLIDTLININWMVVICLLGLRWMFITISFLYGIAQQHKIANSKSTDKKTVSQSFSTVQSNSTEYQIFFFILNQVTMTRKDHPYGNCTSDYSDNLKDMYIRLYGSEYTEMVKLLCIYKYITAVFLYGNCNYL